MIEIEGIKLQHVFTAGYYPQAERIFPGGIVTAEHVRQIAQNYSTAFHESPIWRGHPKPEDRGNDEPEALGWIGYYVAFGDKLYAVFSHVSTELMQLWLERKFKYVSLEIDQYAIDGKKYYYGGALGLTNRPAVIGMEPLNFSAYQTRHNFSSEHKSYPDFTDRVVFTTELSKLNFSETLNHNNTMNEFLKKVAVSLKIDLTKFTTDDGLTDAITKTIGDNSTEVTSLKSKVTELEGKISSPSNDGDPKFTKLQEEIAALKNKLASQDEQNAVTLVETAIQLGKILPADKDKYTKLAKIDFTGMKDIILSMPVRAEFSKKQIKDGVVQGDVNLSDPKFTKNGQTYTFKQYVKDKISKKQEDKDYAAKFTAEDVKQLPGYEEN